MSQSGRSLTLRDLCVAAARKGLYLEVHVWNDDYLEARVGIPDAITGDAAAECVMEVIRDA